MPDRIMPATEFQNTLRAARFTDFETGKADLQPEHKNWLNEAMTAVPPTREFYIYLVGFASKLGPADKSDAESFNTNLSYQRANEVAKYMEQRNPLVTPRIRRFQAAGSKGYQAAPNDNSPVQRAAEAYIFLDVPPPPPPTFEEEQLCPGGHRFIKWSVATPIGFSFSPLPGAVIAGNIVVFRREEGTPLYHTYIGPGVGGGYSWSGPGLSKWKEVLKQIITGLNYSGMSWSSASAETPFNFKDLDDATCQIASGGAGVGPGYQVARLSVYGKVWFKQSNGKCMYASRNFVMNVDTSGKDLQLGVGGSVVGGPLVRWS